MWERRPRWKGVPGAAARVLLMGELYEPFFRTVDWLAGWLAGWLAILIVSNRMVVSWRGISV